LEQVLILTRRELVSAFRESSVVLYSVLLPLLLYPFLLWLMVTAMTYIEGQQERRVYQLAYDETMTEVQPEGQFAELIHYLEQAEKVKLHPVSPGQHGLGRFDAMLRPLFEESAGERILVEYVGDRPESYRASERVNELLAEFNDRQRQKWFESRGMAAQTSRPFEVRGISMAASGDVGGYLLGALLPIGLLVMIALGGAYPAIDTTAGERERGTWETLQSCAPGLGQIVLSKYLFVSLVCCLSGFLNLFAMLVSIRSIVAPMLRQNSQITFEVGPFTLLVLASGVISVSFFVAAALLLCAVFARTFREGQALTTPMFMLIALPVLPLSDPGLEMSSSLALVPLVNLALVWRQALQGTFVPLYLLQTALTLALLIAACLFLGSRLLANEALMSGAGVEPTWRALRRVFRGRSK
jgi:sodium transport system permease protein